MSIAAYAPKQDNQKFARFWLKDESFDTEVLTIDFDALTIKATDSEMHLFFNYKNGSFQVKNKEEKYVKAQDYDPKFVVLTLKKDSPSSAIQALFTVAKERLTEGKFYSGKLSITKDGSNQWIITKKTNKGADVPPLMLEEAMDSVLTVSEIDKPEGFPELEIPRGGGGGKGGYPPTSSLKIDIEYLQGLWKVKFPDYDTTDPVMMMPGHQTNEDMVAWANDLMELVKILKG